ncbi:MAG: hypothetical protein Q8P83_03520 [bacterium]|nr:hypothetical protein [bacterium]
MNFTNKTSIIWLAVVLFIATILGFNFLINKQATDFGDRSNQQKTYEISSSSPDQNYLSQDVSKVPENNQSSSASSTESSDVKIYKNSEYEFEFTYPANFGEVTIKNYECAQGFLVVGSFEHNPNLDFGYVSMDYEKCQDLGFALFQTVSFEASGDKLKLITADPDLPPVEVLIDETIVIPSGSINPYLGYIIKNIVEADGNGDPAAVLSTPNPDIGALTFRTHNLSYEEGVKLLEAIIK